MQQRHSDTDGVRHDTSEPAFLLTPRRWESNKKKTKIIYGKVFCVVIVRLIANSDRLLYLVFEWNVPINAIYAVRFCMVRNFTSFLHFKYFAGTTLGECVGVCYFRYLTRIYVRIHCVWYPSMAAYRQHKHKDGMFEQFPFWGSRSRDAIERLSLSVQKTVREFFVSF